MNPMRIFLSGLCFAAVGACASRMPEKVTAVQDYNADYVCENNLTAQVHFAPFKAVLEFQGTSVDMAQQPTADGYLYAGGGHSVHARGAEAAWTDDKGTVHHCHDHAQHAGRGPAGQRQEGIDALRHRRQALMQPVFEGRQAGGMQHAPDGVQAAHRQLAALFQRGDRVRAQQQQRGDNKDKADKAHENGHGIV